MTPPIFQVLTMVANDGGYSHLHQMNEIKEKIIESLKEHLVAEKNARTKAEVQISSQHETIKKLERELAFEKAAKNKALKALELKSESEKTSIDETETDQRTREKNIKAYECPKMGVWSPHPKNDFFL